MYHDYKFTLSGKLVFDVEDVTNKHKKQSSWKRTAMIIIDNIDLCKYYCWFIKKRYNLELQMPLRGLHFTVINDRADDAPFFDRVKEEYDGKEISFQYGVDPRTDNFHWWVGVKSEDAENIRELAGLSRKPYWGFHITIGRADGDRRLEHSAYIHRLIKKFGKEFN